MKGGRTSYSNTFVMSDNVRTYLEGRGGGRRPLTQADADAMSRHGHLKNFENTPDIGVSLTLAWVALRP